LQLANDGRECRGDDRLTEGNVNVSVSYGEHCEETHLIQGGQKGAETEGGKHDGEVILGQDLGFALFPSSAWLGLLFLMMSGRNGLGVLFGVGHVPVCARNELGGGTEHG
jgi:hypothetical protein